MDSKARKVQEDVKRSKKPTKDYTDVMKQYHEYLRKGECPEEAYQIAFDAYDNNLQKEIIEALLFGEAAPEDITEVFGFSEEAQAAYEELFFDRTKFRNKLDKLAYLEAYPSEFGKQLKMRSMNLGPEFVFYTYGNIVPKTATQRQLVQRMFMAAAYKAMAINYNALDTKVTKNALDHAKMMLKAWEALQKFSEEEMTDETDLLKIAMKQDPSFDFKDNPLVKETDII